MECPNGCGITLEERKMEKILQRGDEPVVVSLTMLVCPECGQEAMSGAAARFVEKVLNGEVEPAGEFTAKRYIAISA